MFVNDLEEARDFLYVIWEENQIMVIIIRKPGSDHTLYHLKMGPDSR
jgi:hypothetical protein